MFEKFLHQTPFFRLVLPLIIGIIIQDYFLLINFPILYGIIFCLLILLILKITRLARNYRTNLIWGFFVSLCFFFFGMQLTQLKQKFHSISENSKYDLVATITENPEEKEKTIKAVIHLNQIKDSSHWVSSNANILCYFQKDSMSTALKIGDQILARTYLNGVKHSGNPHTFNYKRFLKYKEIYYQAYIAADSYMVTEQNKGFWLNLKSNKIRQKLLNIYHKNNITDDEFAVLSALTLGYKAELTSELKESYSTSGAMHILAVSGLHVGIIFIILVKLLFFLQKIKYGKTVQYAIIIIILFFYAFLTGLSNSVLRASIMFAFICIGKMFTRQVNIYNTISASALILLIYNPYAIMDVGFQLSYAAVISIVFFQPRLYALLNIKSLFGDYIWQLISVAIAAQLGTFPITIYYFEQFPLYFILSNILIIPLATVIIYGAILLFCFSFSEIASTLISKILHFATSFLNKNVSFIENLPYSKLDKLLIDQFEIIFLTAFIFSISFFIITARGKFLKYSLWIILIFVSYNLISSYEKLNQSYFTVYKIPKISAIEFVDGNQNKFYTLQPISLDDREIKYNVSPFWKNQKLTDPHIIINRDNENSIHFFDFKKFRIAQLKSNFLNIYETEKKIKLDVIILSNNIKIEINELIKYFDFHEVIFDSSNSIYKSSHWAESCKKLKLKFHDVQNDGAFIKQF